MPSAQSGADLSQEAILADIIEILETITLDWDLDFDGPMGANTRLIGDLAFESIDVVQFIVAIEEQFKRRGLPFEEFLMKDGRYVDEIRVSDAVNFLHRHLNNR